MKKNCKKKKKIIWKYRKILTFLLLWKEHNYTMKRTQVIAWIELVDVVFKKKIIIKKKPTNPQTHTHTLVWSKPNRHFSSTKKYFINNTLTKYKRTFRLFPHSLWFFNLNYQFSLSLHNIQWYEKKKLLWLNGSIALRCL